MNGLALNISMMMLSIGLVAFATKRNNLSTSKDLGLVFPKVKDLLFWATLFIVLIFIEDYASSLQGDEKVDSWLDKYTALQIVIRVLGIVVLAPISEELIFRGLLFWKIKTTQLGTIGAIVLPAILFSLIHIQYAGSLTFLIIFIDGLFYGFARHHSGSVILAIILHALSNLGAVLERLV